MLKFRLKAFIMLESIISLAILSLGVFSLTSTYWSSYRATKKFSEQENLAFCLRSAAMARQKQTQIPRQITINSVIYEISLDRGKIKAINLSNQHQMEINWNEK
ncbi:hypothetical protein [Xylocopilactobacillus apicola]|uniref:Type II secretion system protein n=1 Tax=Xylocopilactobacillus apicola TaxID=2932184 RepID=A0AAU9D434_9LACO|nr:hypothetical protein [Xylocopilactobacillus apicola]BDR58539.1 hypothetical protein XA3_09800 [Xylocopilactobacillus apicola]BDR58561.1 hypothetical protein XA3_10020 [Xylocopilactobacillus apicola]